MADAVADQIAVRLKAFPAIIMSVSGLDHVLGVLRQSLIVKSKLLPWFQSKLGVKRFLDLFPVNLGFSQGRVVQIAESQEDIILKHTGHKLIVIPVLQAKFVRRQHLSRGPKNLAWRTGMTKSLWP